MKQIEISKLPNGNIKINIVEELDSIGKKFADSIFESFTKQAEKENIPAGVLLACVLRLREIAQETINMVVEEELSEKENQLN